MKVSINAPMKGKEITELLEGYAENGVSFKFAGKTGLRHDFDVEGIGGADAAALVKKLVKAQPYGAVLYFSVEYSE